MQALKEMCRLHDTIVALYMPVYVTSVPFTAVARPLACVIDKCNKTFLIGA